MASDRKMTSKEILQSYAESATLHGVGYAISGKGFRLRR